MTNSGNNAVGDQMGNGERWKERKLSGITEKKKNRVSCDLHPAEDNDSVLHFLTINLTTEGGLGGYVPSLDCPVNNLRKVGQHSKAN